MTTTLQSRRPAPTEPLPPHNLEAEEAVIGAILAGGSTSLARLQGIGVRRETFYGDKHRHIWSAAERLANADSTLDSITIVAALREAGCLEDAGGITYVNTLAGQALVTSSPAHARILMELEQRREAIRISRETREAAQNGFHPQRLRDLADQLDALTTSVVQAQPSAAAKCLHTFDLEEALASPPPPVDWVVDTLIEAGVVTVLHGDGGVGKSLLSLMLARGVAAGTRMLHRETRQGHVVIIDGENPAPEITRRIHALQFAGITENITYLRAHAQFLHLQDAEATLTKALSGATLAIIDSQRATWGGDEKEAVEIRSLYTLLNRVAETTGAALLVIHHDRRTGDYSGSSDINASPGARFQLTQDKTSKELTLSHEKARSGPLQPRISYALRFLDGTLAIEITSDRSIPSNAREAAKWIHSRGAISTTSREIAKHLSIDERTVRNWVKYGHFHRLGITSHNATHTPTPGNTPTSAETPTTKPNTTSPEATGNTAISTELAPETAGSLSPKGRDPSLPRPAPTSTPNPAEPPEPPSGTLGHNAQKADGLTDARSPE